MTAGRETLTKVSRTPLRGRPVASGSTPSATAAASGSRATPWPRSSRTAPTWPSRSPRTTRPTSTARWSSPGSTGPAGRALVPVTTAATPCSGPRTPTHDPAPDPDRPGRSSRSNTGSAGSSGSTRRTERRPRIVADGGLTSHDVRRGRGGSGSCRRRSGRSAPGRRSP